MEATEKISWDRWTLVWKTERKLANFLTILVAYHFTRYLFYAEKLEFRIRDILVGIRNPDPRIRTFD